MKFFFNEEAETIEAIDIVESACKVERILSIDRGPNAHYCSSLTLNAKLFYAEDAHEERLPLTDKQKADVLAIFKSWREDIDRAINALETAQK